MSMEDAMKLIAESKQFLEPYRAYGPIITEGITQLEKLEKLVKEGANAEAYSLICSMCEQISPYRGLVAELAVKLDQIKNILRKNA